MKKLLIIIFTIISFNSVAVEKSTTFTNQIFKNALLEGKIVVINSWNKMCITCAAQVKILNSAEKEFKDVIFLSFEQTNDKEIAKLLKIDYWTTIVIYKNDEEIYRSIGQTNKAEIFSIIKKSI
tara:strand:+ start:109 stop:480 length:372 start_codon:yes stop_codon:yes gene_type:complete